MFATRSFITSPARSIRFASKVAKLSKAVAAPHKPAAVSSDQAPNRITPWTESQQPREEAMVGPRFEQTAQRFQPRPLAAIELIAQEPIRLVGGRVAVCDGGGGSLGHPKVFINLDRGVKACSYCGIRFDQDHDAHHHHH